MKKVKSYLDMMRIKHYIKNLLIFMPLIFSGNFLNSNMLLLTIIEFFSFCLATSTVYIINDLQDCEKDKLHPVKKNRPIACGKIKKNEEKFFALILILLSITIQFLLLSFNMLTIKKLFFSMIIIFAYIFINIFYSIYAKHIPILDILVLALGFIFRVYFGGCFLSIEISNWLYLTVLSFSLYIVLGKRKDELSKNSDTSRKVLKYYNSQFLDKFMYIYLTLTLVFYSLWCMNFENDLLLYSIFIIIFIVMKYSLNIENVDGYMQDPVEILLHDKILLISIFIYLLYIGVVLYGKSLCL